MKKFIAIQLGKVDFVQLGKVEHIARVDASQLGSVDHTAKVDTSQLGRVDRVRLVMVCYTLSSVRQALMR